MRVVSALLLLVASSAWAFDAVVFSNDQVLSRDFPSFDNLVSTATVESPLIVLTLPGFNLGQFSKAANVYTDKTTTVPSAVTLVKSAKSHVSRFLKNPIELTSAAHITSTTEQIPSAPILVAEATDWLDLDTLLSSLTPLSGSTWTAVLTSNDAVSVGQKRVKRVSTSALDDEGGPSVRADNNGILAPLLLPPFTRKDGSGADVPGLVDNSSRATWGDCLFYLEGFDIVTYYYKDGNSYNYVSTPIRKFTYDWSPSYVKCPIPFLKDAAVPNGVTPFNNTAEFVFEVDATTTEESRGFQPGSVTLNATSIAAGTKIHFRVTILYHLGWYNLTRFELLDSIAVKSEDPTNYIDITGNIGEAIDLQNVGLTAANDAGWVCSVSQAAFVAANSNANASAAPMKGDLLGVELVNAHIQLYGISWPVLTTDTWNNTVTKLPRFSYQAHDCNGAFSTASWMGIISSLVMVTILLFGYLMLQSVQTMDRFDDPKAKQILINVRE